MSMYLLSLVDDVYLHLLELNCKKKKGYCDREENTPFGHSFLHLTRTGSMPPVLQALCPSDRDRYQAYRSLSTEGSAEEMAPCKTAFI